MQFVEDRLHLAPPFRRRIVNVPFDADYPWWIEDENFDIEFHIRHIALPEPGDWRQLCILCARLISRPLDLSKPLWEMYVIDGLDRVKGYPPGCFGVLSKVHHAAVDGASGTEIGTATQDLSPDAAPPPPPKEPWRGEPQPTDAELLARAGWNAATQPWRFIDTWTRGDMANRLRQAAAVQSTAPPPAPGAAHPVQRAGLGSPRGRRRHVPARRHPRDALDRARFDGQRRAARDRRRRAP